jgi:hypothetical protein
VGLKNPSIIDGIVIFYDNPPPEITKSFDPTHKIVATPLCAKVLLPTFAVPAYLKVTPPVAVVMAIFPFVLL